MFRYFFLSCLLVFGIAKSYVFYLERSVISLKKQINKQNELLSLLKVEWTYLNQNSRLQKLAQIYLKDWQAIEPAQMKNIQQLKLMIMQENISKETKDIIKTSDSEKYDLKRLPENILCENEKQNTSQLPENSLVSDNKLLKIENNKSKDKNKNLKKQTKQIKKKNKKAR